MIVCVKGGISIEDFVEKYLDQIIKVFFVLVFVFVFDVCRM